MTMTLRKRRVGAVTGADVLPPSQRRLDLWIAAPIAACAAYVVTVVVRLPSVLSSFYWYSDFPGALRLGDAVFHGGYGQGLLIASQSGIGPLWLVGLMNQTTGGEVAGMTLGFLMVATATAFMVWTARRVLGSARAVLVGVLCVAVPPVVAWEFLSPVAHASTLLMTAVLSWQVVALAQATRRGSIAKSVAVGVLGGVCIVSDPLVLAAAVGPWIVCAVVIASRHPQRRAQLIVTAAVAAGSAALLQAWSNASGIVERSNETVVPTLQGIAAGFRTTALTLGQMLSGAWYSDAVPAAVAVCATAAFALLLYFANRATAREPENSAAGRDLYVWFWTLSSAGLVAALCVSGLGIQLSPVNYQGHYVDGIWLAIAALLPVAVLRAGPASRVVVGAITAVAIVSTIGIARMPQYPFQGPDYRDAAQLVATLQQLGVTHGYGGFWESYAIGWHTDQRISTLPLQTCANTSGTGALCRYEFAPPAFYRTQPGSVFVVALRAPCMGDDLCISTTDLAGLPAPEEVRIVGFLQVSVYAHDVFASLPRG